MATFKLAGPRRWPVPPGRYQVIAVVAFLLMIALMPLVSRH
jgi:hypothetical protein